MRGDDPGTGAAVEGGRAGGAFGGGGGASWLGAGARVAAASMLEDGAAAAVFAAIAVAARAQRSGVGTGDGEGVCAAVASYARVSDVFVVADGSAVVRLASSSRAKTNTAVEMEMMTAETAAMKEPRTIVPRCHARTHSVMSGALVRLSGGGCGQVTAHSDKWQAGRRDHKRDESDGSIPFLDKEDTPSAY